MVYLIQHLLINSAKLYPDKDAVICGDEKITYKVLDEVTNKLAAVLKDCGVKRGIGFEPLATDEHSQELVLSHPRMSITDHQREVMIIHAHHLFHTFKTCHFVNRYLDLTMGIKHSQLFESFLGYVEDDNELVISTKAQLLRDKIFKGFSMAGRRHGADIDETLNMIAYAFWKYWESSEELFLGFYHEFLSTSLGSEFDEQ